MTLNFCLVANVGGAWLAQTEAVGLLLTLAVLGAAWIWIRRTRGAARLPFVAAMLLSAAVFSCSIYANLSFAVANPADYRFFPPFKPNVNANQNRHLGAEYFNLARALTAGKGFADPFDGPTGPTAWQAPVLPVVLAGLLWLCDGSRDALMAVVIFLQVFTLIGTGFLVMALVGQTTGRIGPAVTATVFFLGVLCNFQLCFQWTHDCWFVLLILDLLIAGFCWLRPLHGWHTAAGWGVFGGVCALTSPVVGFTWGMLSFLVAWRQRVWSRFAVGVLFAGLALTPWMGRNYRVLGRPIPVKSNLAFELYQTHCLQTDGLLRGGTFAFHPYHANTRERKQYEALGEIAYLDLKKRQFLEALRADPGDFVERIGRRFLGATLWYVPFWGGESERTWALWISRVTHPLPLVALLVLVVTGVRRLHAAQWIVIGVYLVYLLPYVGISYYDRYAIPLLGVKVLLVIWAADRLLIFWPREKGPSEQEGLPMQDFSKKL